MHSQVEMFKPDTAPITLFHAEQMQGYLEALELPEGTPDQYTMDQKIDLAISSILAVLKLQKSIMVMVSFGKDSSVLLALTLAAVEKAKDLGIDHPTVHVLNSDTGRENPVITNYANSEIIKLRSYVERKDIKVKFHKVTPRLTENFLCLMIGGKDVMSMPGMDRKCQSNLKASPLARAKSNIMKEIAKELGIKPRQLTEEQCLTLTGTRFDESNARSRAMRLRGESSTIPTLVTKNGQRNWVLSPVSEWLEEDIYTFIASVTNARRATYSDFHALTEVYRDSMGECMALMGVIGLQETATGCGARHGCFTCGVIETDRSLENLIQSKPEYAFMQPLNDIRDYMVAQTFDPTKRCWTARSVNSEGRMTISPNTYAPHYTEELLRIMITADVEEWERTNGKPEFKIISFEELIYIDTLWSRYGYHTGHHALRIWDEIWEQGARYYVPDNYTTHKRITFPTIKDVPFADTFYSAPYNGFLDIQSAAADPNLFKGSKTTVVTNEQGEKETFNEFYFAANTEGNFTIDQEGLDLFLEFEYDRFVRNIDRKGEQSLFTYMRLGFVSLNSGGHAEWDRMIRVGTQIHRHGIKVSELNDPVAIVQRIVSALDLPETELAAIDKQLSNRSFTKFYQDHYFKPVTLTDGSEFTVQSVRRQEHQLELITH